MIKSINQHCTVHILWYLPGKRCVCMPFSLSLDQSTALLSWKAFPTRVFQTELGDCSAVLVFRLRKMMLFPPTIAEVAKVAQESVTYIDVYSLMKTAC